MKIVGTMSTSFEGKDGTRIEGMTIYALDEIDPKRGVGQSADRFFVSRAKLDALDFKPAVGQNVEVVYNKYGKLQNLRLLDEEVIS